MLTADRFGGSTGYTYDIARVSVIQGMKALADEKIEIVFKRMLIYI